MVGKFSSRRPSLLNIGSRLVQKHEDNTLLGSADWSSLPEDIWNLVLGKLQLVDLLRCRSVCKLWITIIRNLNQCAAPQCPWLLIPPSLIEPEDSWRFVDIAHDKVHKIHLPELTNNVIQGSSDGWLLLRDKKTWKLRLFNPFSRNQIHLPTLPNGSIFDAYISISKNHGFTIVIDQFRQLVFARTGDKEWNTIRHPGFWACNAMGTFCKDLFYVFNDQVEGQVLSFDLSRPDGGNQPCILPVKVPPRMPKTCYNDYLTVLPGSDELFLLRLSSISVKYNFLDDRPASKKFEAFKLDEKEATEVRNLGGHSLFRTYTIGSASYSAISVAHAQGFLKGNCMYIADTCDRTLNVIDMDDHSVTRVAGLIEHARSQSFWVTPVLVKL